MTETDLRLDLTTAEMYSVGVVMFQILTHHLPFDLTPCPGLSLPAQLDDAETALEWAQHHSIHQQQLPLVCHHQPSPFSPYLLYPPWHVYLYLLGIIHSAIASTLTQLWRVVARKV